MFCFDVKSLNHLTENLHCLTRTELLHIFKLLCLLFKACLSKSVTLRWKNCDFVDNLSISQRYIVQPYLIYVKISRKELIINKFQATKNQILQSFETQHQAFLWYFFNTSSCNQISVFCILYPFAFISVFSSRISSVVIVISKNLVPFGERVLQSTRACLDVWFYNAT